MLLPTRFAKHFDQRREQILDDASVRMLAQSPLSTSPQQPRRIRCMNGNQLVSSCVHPQPAPARSAPCFAFTIRVDPAINDLIDQIMVPARKCGPVVWNRRLSVRRMKWTRASCARNCGRTASLPLAGSMSFTRSTLERRSGDDCDAVANLALGAIPVVLI